MSKLLTNTFTFIISIFSFNNANCQCILNFDSKQSVSKWKTINDDVMGGVSTSGIAYNNNDYAIFSGNVSLKNNGGFASIRRQLSGVNLYNKKSIVLRVKGDGKNYQLRIKKNRFDYYSYVYSFPTSGNWESVSVDLASMYPSFRGQRLNFSNFSAKQIQQISILIANDKEEEFNLIIDEICIQ